MGPLYQLPSSGESLVRVVQVPVREQALFQAALLLAKEELTQLAQNSAGQQKDLMEFQRMLLDDASIQEQITESIAQGVGAARAVEQAARSYASVIENLPDDYLSQRWVDVLDAFGRVVKILDGQPRTPPHLEVPCILVAERVYPSDLISMDHSKLMGIATAAGSVQSHAAILARSMGVPAVVQLGADLLGHGHHQAAILDAYNGELLVQPEQQAVRMAQRRIVSEGMVKRRMYAVRQMPSVTRGGLPFTLLANCCSPEEIHTALEEGAQGIGFLRSEFLASPNRCPLEEEQFYYYKSCLQAAQGKPVTIGTFDLGSAHSGAAATQQAAEPLALRGIRHQLANPELFLMQVRALLRAAVYGQLRITFPLLASPEEWRQVQALVQQARQQLWAEGAQFQPDVPLGALIEVPSAALMAQEILEDRCSFAIIGTNDLTQYTYAADRQDMRMGHYFTGFAPAVDRLVNLVLDAARRCDLPVYVCGMKASDPQCAERYLRKGITGLSVETRSLLPVKARLLDSDVCVANPIRPM